MVDKFSSLDCGYHAVNICEQQLQPPNMFWYSHEIDRDEQTHKHTQLTEHPKRFQLQSIFVNAI